MKQPAQSPRARDSGAVPAEDSALVQKARPDQEESGVAQSVSSEPTVPAEDSALVQKARLDQEESDETTEQSYTWERWKGSTADVANALRRALALLEEATGAPEEVFGSLINVHVIGGQKGYRTVDEFETAVAHTDRETLRSIGMMIGFSQSQATIHVNFAQYGTHLSVRGKNRFAVAGIAAALKAQLDKGRRWTQIAPLRPHFLHLVAPWMAIVGLALIVVIGGSVAQLIGSAFAVLAFLMLTLALFMTYVEPRLVPGFELLEDPDADTRAQSWRRRAAKALVYLGVAVVGALINEFTDILF